MEIGWLGIGNMGMPMAERLVAGNVNLMTFDIRAEAMETLAKLGASTARSARDLADCTDILFFCLPSLEATRAAILGPDGAMHGKRAKILVNTGTVGTALIDEINEAATARGKMLVDCPVSGGAEGARAGRLSVMVSGAPEGVAAIRPYIEQLGSAVTVAGEKPGAAQMLKLVNNLIFLSAYVSTLEAFVLGAKSGLDPQVMLNAINAGSLAPNGTTKSWLPDFVLRDLPVGATLEMMVKDMGAALDEAHRFGVPAPVCEATGTVAKTAVTAGMAKRDVTELIRMIEDAAGFQVPRTPR
ncbi:MAG: NAD(P)-dependent oxidoreductase [Flavobacteriaceae bacterium]